MFLRIHRCSGVNPGLNISTGDQTTSGKKLSYVRRKLLHNGHSNPA